LRGRGLKVFCLYNRTALSIKTSKVFPDFP
jgi:hypothetical protein